MPFSTTGKNTMLGALPSPIYASLHSGDPGATGANEISGGSPAYARKSVTLNAAASGQRTASTQPVFDVPAGTTIMYVGYWDALTNGNFLGSDQLDANETYGGQGTYTLTSQTFSIT